MRIFLLFFAFFVPIRSSAQQKILLKPFYFVRHGMTDWNVAGKQHGQADIELNDAGRDQVRTLAPLCKALPITHFCSSTLLRAHETMKILNSSLNLPESVFDGLKEQGKGALEGITEKEWQLLPAEKIEAEMENKELFRKRTAQALTTILSMPGVPCIVAHSNNLRCIGKLLGCKIGAIPHDIIWYFEPLPDGNGWRVIELKVS